MIGPIGVVGTFFWPWFVGLVCKHRGHREYHINDSVFTLCLRCGKRSVKPGMWF